MGFNINQYDVLLEIIQLKNGHRRSVIVDIRKTFGYNVGSTYNIHIGNLTVNLVIHYYIVAFQWWIVGAANALLDLVFVSTLTMIFSLCLSGHAIIWLKSARLSWKIERGIESNLQF